MEEEMRRFETPGVEDGDGGRGREMQVVDEFFLWKGLSFVFYLCGNGGHEGMIYSVS